MEQEQGDGGHSAPASASRRLIHILDLNVGGKVFTTTTATLKASMASGNSGRISMIGVLAEAFLVSHEDEQKDALQALMSGLDSLGVVVSRAPPGEVGRLELFIDRNPDAFGVVLDMLRTSRFMLPPSISHEMAEVELHHYGIPTAGMKIKDSAVHTLGFMYGEHIAAFVALCDDRLQRASLQGRLRVSVGLISMPFGIGIREGDSKDACKQLSEEFDHAQVSDDMMQVMSIRECRWEATRRLGEGGVFCEGGYNKGDVYGSRVPVHVWFVAGFERELVRQAARDLEAGLAGWKPLLESR